MTRMNVENPTHRSKAVREAGGLTVIKPGAAADVDGSGWSEEYRRKLSASGLVISEGEAADEPQGTGLRVVDKGRGWFVVMDGDQEVTKSMRADDVPEFDGMSEADKAAFVAANKPE
ncbi:hypothetical protein [Tropicimonas sp. IMCC34011]|uniref:hypothetical protein n=1 Tax=Tropicimonas sp. IMCC34011 TaxID=2248759 RepID=UPI000E24DFD9|nr:hypothetical protein [Tropicimonas sp. IMCC34011]